jgi:protein-L-isoaspartate(D-aspartate) O-methyltransferase
MQEPPAERMREREALLAELETGGYLTDPRLEEAMLAVPRHLFVPPELRDSAYEDRPLPIGFGQTVSAPHMVAMMTTALQLKEGDRVLEIGTGVGYHAAVVKAVSIEYLPELAQVAKKNLKAARSKVEVHEGDGYDGWAKDAPYDAIYITCAVPDVADALVEQLKDGGHFVAPLCVTRCQLMAGRKIDGELILDDLGPCLFVNAQGELGGGDEVEDDEPEDDEDDGPSV